MSASIDKSVYLKIWQQINPLNEALIRTQKTIQWVQTLLNYEKELTKQPESKKQTKLNKEKRESKEQKKKSDKKIKSDQKSNQSNQNEQKVNKIEVTQKLQGYQPNQNQINEEAILFYIKKYIQTDQYKLLSKPQPQKLSESEPIREEKQKKIVSKSPSKRSNKKSEPKAPQTKFDESLINLTYEEAIFFYYWFKRMYEKDEKERFLQKMRKEQENAETQKRKKEENLESNPEDTQPVEMGYQPKHFTQLTERQMLYLNEESFLSLKQHQPKIHILFKHYAKLSHLLTNQIYTFEERQVLQKMMSLHQWMIFCKEWNILNTKNISEGWEVGKVTREFLMDVYYKNSFFRKEMSFQMFERALIAVASRIYQDCDIYKTKPIDLMLNFLSIKNEQKFMQNLEIRNISYRQGDILSCFKLKNREVFDKLKIIKVTGNEVFKKSKITLFRQNPIKMKDATVQDRRERISSSQLSQKINETNLTRTPTEQINLNQQKLEEHYLTGSLSKVQFNRKNRKSAPEIGLKLPNIENNRFFSKISQNNHLNKFKQYMENEIPQSSSVLRNKITGYHKIHTIQTQEEVQKLSLKNKAEHMKISQIIENKLSDIYEAGKYTSDKLDKGSIKNQKMSRDLNQSNSVSQPRKIKGKSSKNFSVFNSVDKLVNPEQQ